jgi:hypothetical protein
MNRVIIILQVQFLSVLFLNFTGSSLFENHCRWFTFGYEIVWRLKSACLGFLVLQNKLLLIILIQLNIFLKCLFIHDGNMVLLEIVVSLTQIGRVLVKSVVSENIIIYYLWPLTSSRFRCFGMFTGLQLVFLLALLLCGGRSSRSWENLFPFFFSFEFLFSRDLVLSSEDFKWIVKRIALLSLLNLSIWSYHFNRWTLFYQVDSYSISTAIEYFGF